MSIPVGTPPVNETTLTLGFSAISLPTTEPEPVTKLITPAGTPASIRISTNFAAQRGVILAGLKTIVSPEMRAAPIFQQGIEIGKFHGVMHPATPTGCLTVMQNLFGSSEGVVSPKSLLPSPAAYYAMSMASWTSPLASGRTFPFSMAMRRARSSFRSSSSLAAR